MPLHKTLQGAFTGATQLAMWLGATACVAACPSARAWAGTVAATQAPWPQEGPAEVIYDNGLAAKWQDFGWAPRDTDAGQSARINFAALAGWVLVHPNLSGNFTSLTFNMLAPKGFGDFLEVRLAAEGDDSLPAVRIDAAHVRSMGGGWMQVRVPISELNPHKAYFDRIILRAVHEVEPTWVELSQLALSAPGVPIAAPMMQAAYPSRRVTMQLTCAKNAKPISPLIYGIAFNPRRDAKDRYQWNLGPTVRRFGGNPASRYNWRLGNAWNTASDWFYINVNYTGIANWSWRNFLDDNRTHHATAAITVPTIGWVAKDTQSYAYSVAKDGPQRSRFGTNQDIGNGIKPSGARIDHVDPRRTSIPAPPDFVGEWVQAIRRYDDDHGGQRSVAMYFLDNEWSLWNTTHHDVHPEPVTYEETLRRLVDYGMQVRNADPEAIIAAPSTWGYVDLNYSAADAAAGFKHKPDRLAHQDVPYLTWLLQQLHRQESQTGMRIVNMLDVHHYPEAQGVRGPREKNDAATAARRIRSTRSLWDPSYVDESWIGDRIRLVPRLRALIADNYPGLGLSIGEYNFGGEKHMSGALAQAEVLGRFGQEGVDAAFYWTYPAENSYPYYAFLAYRNYDGHGAHFLEHSLPSSGDTSASVFASTDATGHNIVAVLLNFNPHEGAEATIEMSGCGAVTTGRSFVFADGGEGFKENRERSSVDRQSALHQRLPPYSITVLEMQAEHTAATPNAAGP